MRTAKLKLPELSAGTIRATALNILNHEWYIEAWINNNLAVRGRKFIGRKGVGDIIGFVRKDSPYHEPGTMAACEVKKIGDTFKPDQIEFLTNLHNNGGIALQATQEGLHVKIKKFIET